MGSRSSCVRSSTSDSHSARARRLPPRRAPRAALVTQAANTRRRLDTTNPQLEEKPPERPYITARFFSSFPTRRTAIKDSRAARGTEDAAAGARPAASGTASPPTQNAGLVLSVPSSRYWSRWSRQQQIASLRFLLKLSPSVADRPLRLRISDPSSKISATDPTRFGSSPMSLVFLDQGRPILLCRC